MSLATKDNPDISRIHDFWYNRPMKDWFMTPEGLDSECEQQFSELIQDARSSKLDDWQTTSDGSLALIILLDQFPRNVFRGTPDAFSSDPKALDIATHSIAKGWDRNVTITQALTYVRSSCISQTASTDADPVFATNAQ